MTSTIQIKALKDAIDEAMKLRQLGRYEDALACHMATRSKIDDPAFLRKWCAGVAKSHSHLEQHDEALGAYGEALLIPIVDEEDAFVASGIKNNIASVLTKAGRFAQAHLFLDQAEKSLTETFHDDWLAEAMKTRAFVFLSEGNLFEAMRATKRSLELLWFCY